MVRFWATAALGAAILGAAAHAAPIYGNADGNNTRDINDVKLLARIAGGLAPAGQSVIRYSDVAPVVNNNAGQFGDGRITIQDVLRVARQVANPSLADFPAKQTAYAAQQGNTFTIRKFDADGNPTGDETATAGAPTTEDVGGVTYVVNPLSAGDDVQKLTSEKIVNGQTVPFTDAQGRPALGAVQLALGGDVVPFNPPLVLAVYPLQAGTTWTGSTKTKIQGQNVTANYTGTVNGMESVTVPAGTFDDAWKVSITYNGNIVLASATGTDTFWFVPFLGPVQHGFTRTVTVFGNATTTAIMPDAKLVSATVHGARIP